MLKFLVVSAIVLVVVTGWLARPWSEPYLSKNETLRGMTVPLPMSDDCAAITKDGGFAWNAIGSEEALEACMVHVAKALVTPAKMADWLAAQGFTGLPPYETGAITADILVSVHWKDRENPARRPYGGALSRAGDRFFELMRAIPGLEDSYLFRKRHYSLNVFYAADGTVEADAGMNYL